MADITMCEDNECPHKENCYRFTAPINKLRQSYFMKSPRSGNDCFEFVENNFGKQIERHGIK